MGMKTTILLFLSLGGAMLLPLRADHSDRNEHENYRGHSDRRDHFDRQGPRVIIYEDANFRGESITLYLGERMDNLKRVRFDRGMIINDQISSVRVLGGATVLLYDHPYMRGQVLRVTEDIRNLDHRMMPDTHIPWNDRVSSLRVGGSGYHGSDHSDGPPVIKNPDRMIKKAYREVLDRPADPKGLRYYRGLVIDQGWSDRMVRNHLRDSDEYRGETVDRIIRRAYRDILNRDPDPSGLATYRSLMNRRNWTERQVRDQLRNSAEYRNQSPRGL